jgi:hypothetical protein
MRRNIMHKFLSVLGTVVSCIIIGKLLAESSEKEDLLLKAVSKSQENVDTLMDNNRKLRMYCNKQAKVIREARKRGFVISMN